MTIQDFITKRREGAAKIAKEARDKGGVAILTAIHFEAKDPAYATAMTMVNQPGFKAAKLDAFYHATTSGLATIPEMNRFQQLTGKQEVYGEILAFLRSPQDYA